MIFDSVADLFEYYLKYGNENGFPVKKRSSRIDDNGEFKGILCRHALTVLIHKKVQKVPEKYILRRWRKDVRRQHTKVKISCFDWLQNLDNERYDRMCKVFYEVADLATHNEAKTRLVVDRIKLLCKELNEDEGAWGSSLPNSLSGIEHHDRSSSHDIIPMCKQNGIVRSPLAVRSNIGRPPFKRKESKGEQVVRKKKEQEKKVREKEKEVGAGSVFGNLNSDKDSIGGLEVIELGRTQESITMKDHGRNAPHANHPYNSIDAGFPLHLQMSYTKNFTIAGE
ncbi:hypothetical protein IFM89_036520 [Coptis chinensis]|uniref:Protein FAR1-RELATED SEQUENCE n=1 Tax=Coptis chinensis TaxID=261450 RepID=A0A835LPQ9_9MAGN|nr:hypothetical protein IFM89_036520 [Coptis chinensis]